jgi:D-xylulose reductase
VLRSNTLVPSKHCLCFIEDHATALIEVCDLGASTDVAINDTGAQPCIQASIRALRVGGTLVKGGIGKPDIEFPIEAACAKELTIRSSFRYPAGNYELAVKLIESGKVDVKKMITGSVSFENACEALENVLKMEQESRH